MNRTAAPHVATQLAGVKSGDEVISQAVTFIATCNAINYSWAELEFVDIDLDTMGMSPEALNRFLEGMLKKMKSLATSSLDDA